MKNFYRKVAFGLGPDEKLPSDPLEWANNQLNNVPEFSWKGKILPEKELRGYYREWVYGDRKVLRKKFKNDKDCLLYTSPSPRDGLLSRMPSSA